jgi:hypothetical protein
MAEKNTGYGTIRRSMVANVGGILFSSYTKEGAWYDAHSAFMAKEIN